MSVLQHILAKEKGVIASGYLDTLVKAHSFQIVPEVLFHKLKPFVDFRHNLIHRYWDIDDMLVIQNILGGYQDFFSLLMKSHST